MDAHKRHPWKGRSYEPVAEHASAKPDLHGVETLPEVERQYPRVQVVIMATEQDETVVARARTTGATALLTKPFYLADIDAILDRRCGLAAPPPAP